MKNIFIYIVSRIIKLLANLTKILCYIFHFLFPNKRFTIPAKSAPLYKKRTGFNIPTILWQTNFTNRVTLAVYINYLFNRLLANDFEYRFMITSDRADFIKSSFSSEIYDNYSKLQIGAAQADFWRLLVLQKHGGVYLDIDAHFVWFLSSIICPGDNELYLVKKNNEISNYFIASKNDNINLEKLIKTVLENIKSATLTNIYELTGPTVFNQVLDINKVNTKSYRHICNQGNFTNEFFQYIDKPEGKWTREQEKIDIIKK